MSDSLPTTESSKEDAVESRMASWTDATVVAIVTSVLFLVLYSGSAIITDMRAISDPGSVGTWYYAWERFIPFVPIMIVPYMSIDLFFVFAPYTCSDRKELSILGKRLAAVVIGAAICFLLWPLQLAVERPEATGFFGSIYNGFTAMDKPYNLCPSMHIALRTVLAVHYGKHTSGVLRIMMNLWFFLIGCSTLMLYQHHVIDVVGGFVLAILVMCAIDGLPWRLSKVGGTKFAWMYGVIALVFALPIALKPALGWVLWWPAIASGLVAMGYAWVGPAVYRREGGKLTWPAKIVLGPVLAAQWLSWKYYAAKSNAIDHVTDGVYLGRHLTHEEASGLVSENNIGAVVDVCNAFDEPGPLLRLHRLNLPILDLTAPTACQLERAVKFIEANRQHGVLVHCKAGYSRSAAIVAAWLVQTGRVASKEDAFALLKGVRPNIVVRPEIRDLHLQTSSHDKRL